MKNSDMPAYPVQDSGDMFSGLTVRQAFAMAAMQGLAVCPIPGRHNLPESIAETAVKIADATLAELEK